MFRGVLLHCVINGVREQHKTWLKHQNDSKFTHKGFQRLPFKLIDWSYTMTYYRRTWKYFVSDVP